MDNLISFEKLGDTCIYLVLILVNISYCPGIIMTSNYRVLMSIIIGIIFLTLAINIKHKLFFALSLYLYYGVFALLVCCIAFLTSGIFILDATYNIFLTITCFLLGYCCKNQTLSFIYRCMKVNILSALFLGLFSVFTNLGGFVISEQYAFSVKNSSGVLLGIAIVLCAFVIKESNVKCSTALWWVVMFLLAVCLLTFRCRTVIISVTMCLIYFLYKNNILYRLLQPIILLYALAGIHTMRGNYWKVS